MNILGIALSRSKRALLIPGLALGAASALAQSKTDPGDALARYQQERATCLSGQSNQDRASCLREAGAAFAQAQKRGLGEDPAQYKDNAIIRCQRLPDADRIDCIARMQGQGTTSGSVGAGGIFRELQSREIVTPNQTKPASDAQDVPAK
jgi:hypothetical protein